MLALGSAFLFGASTPIAKLLLGITDPLLLAGLLYLGSGVGIALVATGEPLPFSSHLSGVFCAESHRRLDAVLLHIKARARERAVVMLQSNHECRGARHQEAAIARSVSEDRGGRVNRVFGFSPLVADFDDVALRRLG